MAKAQKSRLKSWAYTIFIWAFLCIWLSGMTAPRTASACRNDRYEDSKKLRFCNISRAAGGWMTFSARERAKSSRIELEKGIALSQMGEPEKAVEAFQNALRSAQAKPGPWEDDLHRRMVLLEDRKTRVLWVSVVEAAK